MGFININKGSDTIIVSESAYEQVYKSLGWRVDGDQVNDINFTFPNDNEQENDEEPDFDKMNLSKLKAYAGMYEIDINGLTTKAEIKDKIISELYEDVEE